MDDGNVKHPLIRMVQKETICVQISFKFEPLCPRNNRKNIKSPFSKTEINQYKFTQVQSIVTSTTRVKMRGSSRGGDELRSHPRIVPLTEYLTHSHRNTSKYAMWAWDKPCVHSVTLPSIMRHHEARPEYI